jgi:hypothetical protein
MNHDFHPEQGESPLECLAVLVSVIIMPVLLIVALHVL